MEYEATENVETTGTEPVEDLGETTGTYTENEGVV